MPEEIEFRTKPEIAVEMIDRALENGVRVSAWTFDELYGRDGKFLGALEDREQLFVAEIPVNFHGWMREPKILHDAPQNTGRGRPKEYPRLAAGFHSSEVRNLVKHSPAFRKQSWKPWHIKDTCKGPAVWEVKWAVFWRKGVDGLPGRRQCLLVARNLLTGEVKYFLANRVPGEINPVTGKYVSLSFLLRVAFDRWSIESCFRQGKEELGMDHYEVRGWRCVHRHFYVTQLSHLFCARMRLKFDTDTNDELDRLTVEQVRSAMDVCLDTADLPPAPRRRRLQAELNKQRKRQRRNKQARVSHTKEKIAQLNELGIDVKHIKSCLPDTTEP